MAHFRWIRLIRKIRWRTLGGSKSEYSTTILARFAGKWGLILRSTLEKPKENQGFWLQPLKNLGKINVLGPVGSHGQAQGGPRAQPAGWKFRPDFFNFLFFPKLLEMGPQGPGGPWGPYFL